MPTVGDHVAWSERQLIRHRKRWLIGVVVLVAAGIFCAYSGYFAVFYGNEHFQYRSEGVVLPGEPKDLFVSPSQNLPRAAHTSKEAMDSFYDALKARSDIVIVSTRSYRGTLYVEPVKGGHRAYELVDRALIDAPENQFLIAIGLMLTTLGVLGIVLERRLSS